MKKTLFCLLVTSLTVVSLNSFADNTQCGLKKHQGPRFKGSFSYLVNGEFNSSLGAGKVTEVGVFTSDGKGNVTANATVNIVSSDLSTALPSGPASYNCTYTNSDCSSMISLNCVRHQANFTPQDQNLDVVIAMVKGSSAVKIQSMSGGTFGNVQVSGEGSRALD